MASEKKIAVVTGANSGLGYQTCIQLLKGGYYVIMACRSKQRATGAMEELILLSGSKDIEIRELDTANLDSVRKFADTFLADPKSQIHVLLCNAGIWGTTGAPVEHLPSGHEKIFGTNFLGHFLLCELLLPKVAASAPSRISHTSSGMGSRYGDMDLADLQYEKRDWDARAAYSQSKLLQILYSWGLEQRLQKLNPQAHSISTEPGFVKTNLLTNANEPVNFGTPISPAEGAKTQIMSCMTPDVETYAGKHMYASKLFELPEKQGAYITKENFNALIKYSAGLCKIDSENLLL